MPQLIVSLKEGADVSEYEKAKKTAQDQGGKITHESKLIKSFNVEFPPDAVHELKTNDHVDVEEDKEVKTQ